MKHFTTAVAILCFATMFSCSDDSEFDTEAARENQVDGWAAYNREDFSTALLSFERAINLDEDLADAHNGLGWSRMSTLQASSINLQVIANAKEAFEEAIRRDPSNADAWIGLANALFLRREEASDFQTALRAIDNALTADNRFLFRHDYQSAADLHALKAACYYYLGETELAQSAINAVIKIDPQNAAALSLAELLK